MTEPATTAKTTVNVIDRWNGKTLHAVEVEGEPAPREAQRLAVLSLVKDKKPLSGVDLIGAYLRGAYLRGADLSGADLRGANLNWANLNWADLTEADLSGAALTGANLTWAHLAGANLGVKNILARAIRVKGACWEACEWVEKQNKKTWSLLVKACDRDDWVDWLERSGLWESEEV